MLFGFGSDMQEEVMVVKFWFFRQDKGSDYFGEFSFLRKPFGLT